MTDKSNVEKMLEASKNIFNVNFGGMLIECESEAEAVKMQFLADLDSKIRSGELKPDDATVAKFVAAYPTLVAKMPNIQRDIKIAVQMDRNIRGLKKAEAYQAAVKKKQALDEKREGVEPLTKEEERLVALSKYEKEDKAELLKKGTEIAKKEAENRKKSPQERVPLTQEEKDIKEFNAIKGWENYATDNRVAKIEAESQAKGTAKEDYWTNLEQSNEDYKNWKRLYEGSHDLQQNKDKALEEAQTNALKEPEFSGGKTQAKWGDPDTLDWVKFRKEVIWKNLDNLAKINNPADLGFALFTTVFVDILADAISNLHEQTREVAKKNRRDAKTERKDEIDSNLKQRNLNRRDLAHETALDAKRWMLKLASAAKGIDISNPMKLTKGERFIVEMSEFVHSLPKTKDGDLDYSKFSKKQKAQYSKYVVMYCKTPECLNKWSRNFGMDLNKDEISGMVQMTCDTYVKGGMDHAIETGHVEQKAPQAPIRVEKIDADLNQAVDKVFNGEKTTEADRKVFADMLRKQGVAEDDIKKLDTILKDQEAGKPGAKLSEEIKKSIHEVMVSGTLDNYVVADTMSKANLTEADQVKIAAQVERQTKRRKALSEQMQQNDAKLRQLSNFRARESLSAGIEMQVRKQGRGY